MEISLGSFVCDSGKFMVTDPCHKLKWCQDNILDNVKTGEWIASADKIGRTVTALTAVHIQNRDDSIPTTNAPFHVDVDSGQAGIFDLAHYREGDADKWLDVCIDITLTPPNRAGIIPFGAVGESGGGFGSYRCYIARDHNGQVVFVRIVFKELD